METRPFKAQDKTIMREAVASWASYRSYFGNGRTGAADLTWMSALQPSSQLLLTFIEGFVYGSTFNNTIHHQARASRAVEDILDNETVRGSLDEVEEILTTEGKAAQDADTPPSLSLGPAESEAAATPSAANSTAASAARDSRIEAKLKPFYSLFGDNYAIMTDASKAKIYQIVNGWSEEIKERATEIHEACIRQVNQTVKLTVKPTSEKAFKQLMNDCHVGTIRAETGEQRYVIIHYDPKQACEAATMPHIRDPPLRGKGEHLDQCVNMMIKSRGLDGALHEGDLYMVLDNGKEGNHTKLIKPWRASNKDTMEHSRTKLKILYSEEALMQKRSVAKGPMSLSQEETAFIVTKESLNIKMQANRHFNGTSKGSVIGFLDMPSVAADSVERPWEATFAQKKDMFGKSGRADVGGASPDGENYCDMKGQRNDTDVEPANYHAMPRKWYSEVIHRFKPKAIIDFTAHDGQFAIEAINEKVPYLGFTHTQLHADMMHSWLAAKVFQEFRNEDNDDKYKAEVAEFYDSHMKCAFESTETTAGAQAEAKKKAAARRRAAAKRKAVTAKAKAKATAKASVGDEAEPDEAAEGGDSGEADEEPDDSAHE
ncbi:unnamed protein product [Prorocentrum cordatum]|uniref:Uncharacterized protein n=1 Tax=Prorocentrum cordatum TaxID=2364126 RepID=A0ABN9ULJ6_9DINO|nr:unnamed protein product [Polarella glacialis]